MPPIKTKLTRLFKSRHEPPLSPAPNSTPTFAATSDLWQYAFDALESDQQADLLKVNHDQSSEILETVAEIAKQRYVDQQVKAWKVSRGKGKPDVKLRDVTTKLLTSILRYKGLIDIGVTFDPTGHASTVWSALSLVLQVTKNHFERLDAVLEASTFIADAMARYAAIEKNYFRDLNFEDTEFLGKTLVSMFTSMLKLAAGVVHQAQSNVVGSVLASINALTQKPLQELVNELEKKESDVRKWMELLDHQYRKEESGKMNEKAIAILETLEENTRILVSLEMKILTVEEQSILKWLSSYDFSASQNLAQHRWEPGTGAWFHASSEYIKIKAGDIRFLWLYGTSGCGKTVLCSTIVRDLDHLCKMEVSNVLAYWYFSFADRGTLSLGNSLSSLLRQLCSVTVAVPTIIQNLWKKHNVSGSRPSSESLLTVLDGMLVDFARESRQVFLVFDALDECPARINHAVGSAVDEKQINQRSDLLDTLIHLSEKHSNLRIVATSRNEVDIRSRLESQPRLDIEGSLSDDVEIFVRGSLDKMIESDGWKEAYRSRILSRLVSTNNESFASRELLCQFLFMFGSLKDAISLVRSSLNMHRRFRWAYLILLDLSDCLDAEQIEQALRTIPETLEKAYEQILSRIPKRHKEKAQQLLMWLSYSFWPLTLEEAAAVLKLYQPRDVLRIFPSGIVTSNVVKEEASSGYSEPMEREELKFDHSSVKEYLASISPTDLAVAEFFIEPPLAHLSISQQCVSRVLENNREEAIIDAEFQDPFKAYSTFLWFRHVQCADAFEKLRATSPPFEDWQPSTPPANAKLEELMNNLRSEIHRIFQEEFTTAFRNWCETMAMYDLVRNRDVSSRNAQTIFAAYDDLRPIDTAVMLTLPNNLHRLLDDGHIAQTHLLHYAVCQGEPEIVAILLERTGLDVDLSRAIERIASDALDMLETIFRLRPGLEVTDELFWRASQDRYYEHHIEDSWSTSVQYLLERRDHVMLSEVTIRQIIEHQGDPTTVRLLLQYSDNTTISDTSLELAARYQGPKTLCLLVQHRPTEIRMDELLLKAAQNTKDGEEVTRLLLTCIPQRKDDEAVAHSEAQNVNAATANDAAQEYRLDPQVVELAAANPDHGIGMLIAFFQHFGDIPVTEGLMLSVARNLSQGLAMMQFLVLLKGLDLPVSQTLVGVVEEKSTKGWEQMKTMYALLVKYCGLVEAGSEPAEGRWVDELFKDVDSKYLEPFYRGGKG